jgi:hypothetical protein
MRAGENSELFVDFAEQWLKTWQHASVLSQMNLMGMALLWDPQLRGRWFAQVSGVLDSYMRSPAFLELMQRSLRTITVPTSPCGQGDRRVSDGDDITRDNITPLP